MKKTKLLAVLLTAFALGLASCNNASLPEPQGGGQQEGEGGGQQGGGSEGEGGGQQGGESEGEGGGQQGGGNSEGGSGEGGSGEGEGGQEGGSGEGGGSEGEGGGQEGGSGEGEGGSQGGDTESEEAYKTTKEYWDANVASFQAYKYASDANFTLECSATDGTSTSSFTAKVADGNVDYDAVDSVDPSRSSHIIYTPSPDSNPLKFDGYKKNGEKWEKYVGGGPTVEQLNRQVFVPATQAEVSFEEVTYNSETHQYELASNGKALSNIYFRFNNGVLMAWGYDSSVPTGPSESIKVSYTITISAIGSTVVEIPEIETPESYNLSFEMDISTFATWTPKVDNFSLYLFNEAGPVCGSKEENLGNLNDGSLVVELDAGVVVTGAIFYFKQGNETKESTEIAVNISEANEYIITYVDQWEEIPADSGVWKMSAIDISLKHLLISKNVVSILKDASDTVVASNWMGNVTCVPEDGSIASASFNEQTGAITITGLAAGNTTVAISDGITNYEVAVEVRDPDATYKLKFEADLSLFSTWGVKDYAIYLFSDNDYIPVAWNACQGNLNSGEAEIVIDNGKAISHAIFYYVQNDNQVKQSIDLDFVASEAGTYTISFVDQWAESPAGSNVWKMTGVTISPKAAS